MLKIKQFLLILAVVATIAIISITIALWDIDGAIIKYGIGFVKFLKALRIANILIYLASTITMLVLAIKKVTDATATEKIRKAVQASNPYPEEPKIIEALTANSTLSTGTYQRYSAGTLAQIQMINEELDNYHTITDSYDYPILESISKELISAKRKTLANAKSINNRVTIQNGADAIERLISDNDNTYIQVKDLVLQAIDYVDVKTPRTDSNLENLTSSLEDLIKTINS